MRKSDNNFVRSAIERYGIEVKRDDGEELACLCPFHNNSHSPAFYINKRTGMWLCFNPNCGKKGSLSTLSQIFGDKKKLVITPTLEDIESALEIKDEKKDDWMEALERVSIDWTTRSNVDRLRYMFDRGFREETLRYFEVGFSEKKERIVIPARDEHYKLAGFIGRSTDPESTMRYKYSKGFPRKDILWNLQNAKQYFEVVVVEGSLDAMMVHQAGFPNVVATLGATVTDRHIDLLSRYFSRVYLFGDNDEAGMAMNKRIVDGCPRKDLWVVRYQDDDYKDPGSMPESLIRDSINNAIDYFSFAFYELEK